MTIIETYNVWNFPDWFMFLMGALVIMGGILALYHEYQKSGSLSIPIAAILSLVAGIFLTVSGFSPSLKAIGKILVFIIVLVAVLKIEQKRKPKENQTNR